MKSRPLTPLVVMPAFNEAATIARIIGRVRAQGTRLAVLVIDDGSTDATARRARDAGAHVVRLPFNMGYGVALQTGYKYALHHGYDCVIQLDGDGQQEHDDITGLLGVVERGGEDLGVGSRLIWR